MKNKKCTKCDGKNTVYEYSQRFQNDNGSGVIRQYFCSNCNDSFSVFLIYPSIETENITTDEAILIYPLA
jgi:transposase-like protein